jgi:membrane protein implicated in regulation of membrane protease activity
VAALEQLLFTPWGWFILAILLACLEIAAPGAFMIWLAGAALATGLLTLLPGVGWEVQLAVFALLAIASVVGGRSYLARHPTPSADELLNRRAARLVGELVTVVEPIRGGEGRVQLGDSPWLAAGPDMPAGARARILRVEGSRLHVEPA